MINVRDTKYKTVLLAPGGARIELQCLSESRQENKGELAQKAMLTLRDHKVSGVYVSAMAKLGAYIFMYANGTELFRGPIYSWERRRETGTEVDIVAYDLLYQLQQSQDNRFYKAGSTGQAIAKDILNEWNIPIGSISGPTVAIGKKVYRGDSLSEMILDAFDSSKKVDGKAYVLQGTNGKVDSFQVGSNAEVYHFQEELNLIQTADKLTIEDLVTRVKIVGRTKDDKDVSYGVVDGKLEYGKMQRIYTRGSDETMAEATKEAKNILEKNGKPERSTTIIAPDVPTIRKGHKVKVTADGLSGYFNVLGIQHDHLKRTMTMEVGI